jgi:hypothetical protein
VLGIQPQKLFVGKVKPYFPFKHKLSKWRKEAAEKYLSHFTVDRHQQIIRQGEIDMESLLPPLQDPTVSAPDLSLMTFME